MPDRKTKLTMSIGPMKSSKSHYIIGKFATLHHTKITHGLFQPVRNVRDEDVESRNGISAPAEKINSLFEIVPKNLYIVGIEEIHMFEEGDCRAIELLLQAKTEVIISGLDTDYQGKLFPIVSRLLELGPDEVIYNKAVCDKCSEWNAVYSQVLYKDGKPVLCDLPPVLPDDGTYIYQACCRKCFIKK